jgi:hypothetical protein
MNAKVTMVLNIEVGKFVVDRKIGIIKVINQPINKVVSYELS